MECNITDEELEKRYDKVNISHEPMYYPFSEGQKAERVVVDLVHNNSSMYYVHIEFSPVGVFYTGDMGSFTFNGRLISQPKYFFSGSHINPHYWKEKVCAAEQGYNRLRKRCHPLGWRMKAANSLYIDIAKFNL